MDADALIDWDETDDEMGNISHVAEHGLTPAEVESVLYAQDRPGTEMSDSSGRPIVFGMTDTGRYIVVIYEVLNEGDPQIIHPITAYEVPEPKT